MAGILLSVACVVAGYLIEYLVAPIGPMFVEYLFGPIASVITYIYYYKGNSQCLRKEIDKLMLIRERVKHMVDEAGRNGEEIESDVQKWLKSVHEITEEASRFFEVEENAQRRVFCGLFPNFKLRYQLSRKAMEMVKIADELLEDGRFDRVSYSVTPRWKGFAPIEGYKAFDSRMSTSTKIMATLRNESVTIIGVYGMGGVGKTTLLKELGRQALEDKLFDDVVMATVTQNPDVKKIQGEIADRLGLRFDEESVAGRAGHLRERLKKKKKILVILDDIWARLDMEEVGIPYGNAHKGCKILLASRSLDVLSTEMDAQITFAVGVLTDEEAWVLFRKMAGDSVEDPDLQSTAVEIVRECAGLPVAIVTVARALRDKNSFEWKNASRQLKRPNSRNMRGMQAVIYSTLELSYHQLESEELKSTFLICGMMNYNASIQDLLKYGMGLGLFQDVYTTEEARDRIYTLVRNLKASCLLVDGTNGDCFSMHDVVRDVATSIASRKNHVFVVRDDVELLEWPDEDTLNKCTAISLQYCDIRELPDRLHCPKLKFFYMGCDDPSLRIPDKFFKGLNALKVLHMEKVHFPSLPSSLCFMESLRTLCLDRCVLVDVAIVGQLKKLVILSFAGSDIAQLPKEFKQLTRLKALDLSNCTKLKVIPPNVLSSMFQLEELHMANSFVGWEDPLNTQRGNASIAELKELPHLVYIDIHIPDAKVMPKDLLFESLKRYRIFIGDVWDWSGENETSKTLKLKLDTSIQQEGAVMLLKRAEDLYLHGLEGLRNVIYELDSEGFPLLKHLHVQNSSEIQYLIDSMEGDTCTAFPILESLVLHKLINLEKICHVQLTTMSFHKLRIMKVENCDRLKNLFSFSIFRGLVELQEIKITDCKVMHEIVTMEGEDDIGEKETSAEIQFLHLHSLELECLPELKSFCSKVMEASISPLRKTLPAKDQCSEQTILENELDSSTPLFSDKIVFSNLELLKLSAIGSQTLWQDQTLRSTAGSSFHNLTLLRVKGCHNLTYLLSSSASVNLVKLKRLEIHKCNAIKDIFITTGEAWVGTLSFPQLEFLSLKGLPHVTRFCWGSSVVFPSLNKLYIKRCPKLKEFISSPTGADKTVGIKLDGMNMEESLHTTLQPFFSEKVSLPALEVMKISHMHSVKMLWNNQVNGNSFCKLKALKVKHCGKLHALFPSNTFRRSKSLESLIAIDCDSLENVFEVQDVNVEETHAVAATRLRSLYLSHHPKLRHIWSKDPVGIVIYSSLHSVSVSSCPNLKSIFPASVTRDLLQLKQLEIDSCAVQEIVAKEETLEIAIDSCMVDELVAKEEVEIAARFVFPQVTYLRLHALSELRSFYPGLHISEWPSLKKMEVNGCHKVEMVAMDYHVFQERQGAGQFEIPNPHPLFLVEKDTFQNLEELRLEDNCVMMETRHCESLAEFFFSRLRKLKLSKLSELKYLWKENSCPTIVFQNLETLEISYCGIMKSLVAASVSFRHLTSLEISNCDGLENLIIPSTAKSMVHLTIMCISECKMMTGIVEDKIDEADAEIDFIRLKSLKLQYLPILTSFCAGSQSFSFPTLEEVIVSQCPQMQTFCKGVLNTPKLERVYISVKEDQWHWEGNLDATIQQLAIDMVCIH
ncbi:hypothetical protein P3X46_008321 [Hevea brasiliensis]|uniref:AAA+ ATPase domain-containing protein n=3 Tax=Hevea brasiliensis TaxID=3981 RepID=A0ABQ9MKL7_HEVBR|nr:hypothetical protein P3X46_008321 [Hevea brasiliensis]